MANNSINSQRPRCSFCGKDSSMVGRLVAGPGVYICNECVDLCNSILDEDNLDPEERSGPRSARKVARLLSGNVFIPAIKVFFCCRKRKDGKHEALL